MNIDVNKVYTVFVGGAEVNDDLLSIDEARKLADDYKAKNYDDVAIVDAFTDEIIS